MIDYKKTFTQVAKKVLTGENRRTEIVSLAFVSEEEIKKLNRKFRKKNKPTDVLSFALNERKYLGEVVICQKIVKLNAGRYKVSVKEEMIKLFIHGVLHLLGYDHEINEEEAKLMEQKEKFYLSKINL